MPTIWIPQELWGKVWRALVASRPISRLSQEPLYHVSDAQLRRLRRMRLPFELVAECNDRRAEERHG